MISTCTINIYRTDIKKQVHAKAYYTGRGRGETSNSEALISELMEGDNNYIIDSSINKAIANVMAVLGEYSLHQNITDSDNLQQIEITMPDNFDVAAVTPLSTAATQYCEAKVLYDWFAITSPTDAEFYAQQMVLAISDIRNLMRRRLHPVIAAEQNGTTPSGGNEQEQSPSTEGEGEDNNTGTEGEG